MRGIGTRARWLFPLLAVLALSIPASAHAGAGDDAHFLVQQQNASQRGLPTKDTFLPDWRARARRWRALVQLPEGTLIGARRPGNGVSNLLADGGVPGGWQ